MGKRRPQQPGHRAEDQSSAACPRCGVLDPARAAASVAIRNLIDSHQELRSTLRGAGRELLRFHNKNSRALTRIRAALKSAEKSGEELRKVYRPTRTSGSNAVRKPAAKKAARRNKPARTASNSKPVARKVAVSDPPRPSRRLTRPNSHRVLEFPAHLRAKESD